MSRFGRHLKNQMLRFPAQILPMMGFSSCNNSDVFQWPKLVSVGRSCSEPFSCLQHSTPYAKTMYTPTVTSQGSQLSHAKLACMGTVLIQVVEQQWDVLGNAVI